MKRHESRAAFLAGLIMSYRVDRLAGDARCIEHDCNRISRIVAKLLAYTKSAVAFETKYCNVAFSESCVERRRAQMAKRETELFTELAAVGASNMRVALGGDCRGPCGRLIIKDAPGEGFDASGGYAIYS
jgi:hypothetical protein